jgi:hypothetical protein
MPSRNIPSRFSSQNSPLRLAVTVVPLVQPPCNYIQIIRRDIHVGTFRVDKLALFLSAVRTPMAFCSVAMHKLQNRNHQPVRPRDVRGLCISRSDPHDVRYFILLTALNATEVLSAVGGTPGWVLSTNTIAQLIVMLLVARNTAPTVYMYAFVSTPSPPHAENYHDQGIPHQVSISVQLRV